MAGARAHVVITGRVQGVWFRGSTQAEARARNVRGWVRNCPDGTVEALLEGEEEAVRTIVEWCRRGPPGAKVVRVDVKWAPFQGEFERMEIAPYSQET